MNKPVIYPKLQVNEYFWESFLCFLELCINQLFKATSRWILSRNVTFYDDIFFA